MIRPRSVVPDRAAGGGEFGDPLLMPPRATFAAYDEIDLVAVNDNTSAANRADRLAVADTMSGSSMRRFDLTAGRDNSSTAGTE
jgi:hypothetical protein